MTISMWDGVEQRQTPQQRVASATRTALSALGPQFAQCAEALDIDGFENRRTAMARTIEAKVEAAVASDPTMFPLVHQAVMESWHEGFYNTLRQRQDIQQREHARRAYRRAQRRSAARIKQASERLAKSVRRVVAGTQAESDALLARFPESVRERVRRLLSLTVYGPAYNRNVTENLYSAARFAEFGPSALDDMEYLIRKAEAQASYGETGEWVNPIHPRETGRQQDLFGGESQYGYSPNVYNAARQTIIPRHECQAGPDGLWCDCREGSPNCHYEQAEQQASRDFGPGGAFYGGGGEEDYADRFASLQTVGAKVVTLEGIEVSGPDPSASGYYVVSNDDEYLDGSFSYYEDAAKVALQWSLPPRGWPTYTRESSIRTADNSGLASQIALLDLGGTLSLAAGSIHRQVDGWLVMWDNGEEKFLEGPPIVVANYYVGQSTRNLLERAATRVSTSSDIGRTGAKFQKRIGEHVLIITSSDQFDSEFVWQVYAGGKVVGAEPINEGIAKSFDDAVGMGEICAHGIATTAARKTALLDWWQTEQDVSIYSGLSQRLMVHQTNGFGGSAEVYRNPVTHDTYEWVAVGRDNAESEGSAGSLAEAQGQAEAFLHSHAEMEGQLSLLGVRGIPFLAAVARPAMVETGTWSCVATHQGRTAALTLVAKDRMLHWAVTDESGDEEHDSGSGATVRDVLEDAWDALNKALNHEPPPSKEVAQQVEQAADAAGEAVEQAGGAAPDDADPTGGSEGDAAPADGEKGDNAPNPEGDTPTDDPAPSKDTDGDPSDAAPEQTGDDDGGSKSDDAPPSDDASPSDQSADDATPSDNGGSDAPAATPDDGDQSPQKADSGDAPGTAADPESAPSTVPDAAAPDADAEGVVDAAEATSGGDIEGLDPNSMTTGQRVNMTYTLGDGTTGNVDVTFVREDNGVFFFDGPKGQFGIGDRDGVWVDSEGNQFAFSDGDAMEEVTGEDVPEDSTVEELEVDLDAPVDPPTDDPAAPADGGTDADKSADNNADKNGGEIDNAPAQGTDSEDAPKDTGEDNSTDDDDDDDEDFKKKFSSIRAAMISENPHVPAARIDRLARRAARLAKVVAQR